MQDIREIVVALGRDHVRTAIGCSNSAISNVIARGSFPPSWYVALADLGTAKGIEVPAHLFGWKGAGK